MDNTSKKYIVYIFNNWFIVPFILLGMILPLIISMSFFNNESPTFLIITLVIFTIASSRSTLEIYSKEAKRNV